MAVFLMLMFLPIWRDTITVQFLLLEPARQAVVRALVPGRVTAVLAEEGQHVHAGDPLLSNNECDS